MSQEVDRGHLLQWECNKKYKPKNRNRDALDYMGVPDQLSDCSSNKPTFSPITQAVPEIWPKRWTEYRYCHVNVMKIQKPTSRNRDTLDIMGVPDQPSYGHSNKPTFSQIRLAVLEIWLKRWTEYSCCHANVMKIHKHTNRIEMPLILWMSLINHLMAIPTNQLSAKSHKHFL